MSEIETPKCSVCGAEMVKATKKIKLDGSLKMDRSFLHDGVTICPKCHPEYAKED